MHQVMKDATLFFGEGASMASESAVLGVPAIYVNDLWAGSTNDLTRFGLMFSYKQDEKSQIESINKGIELLSQRDLKPIWKECWNNFMQDKIDVTAFFVWFIENYPESAKIMKENPNYQDRFR